MSHSLVLVVLLSSLMGCFAPSPKDKLLGAPAPDTRLSLVSGSYRSIQQYRGKILVLAFWDADCSHCRQAIPKVNELGRAFVGDDSVSFVAVNINKHEARPMVKQTIEDLNLDALSHAFSGNDVLDEAYLAFQGEEVPYLVLVDKKGVVRWLGRDPDQLKAKLVSLIKDQ